jgi:hypothetical protein
MFRLAVTALLLISTGRARAESRFTGMIGLGVGIATDSEDQQPNRAGTSTVWSVDSLLAYRITPSWSLGVRLSIAGTVHSENFQPGGAGDEQAYDFTTTPLDGGLTARYQHERLWIAPWVGVHGSIGTLDESGAIMGDPLTGHSSFHSVDFMMLGVTAGFDILGDDDNKLAAYVDFRDGLGRDASNHIEDPPMTNWRAVTVGVAYSR